MSTHVKVLGVLFIAVSALGVLAALFLMIALGGAAGIVGATADPEEAAIALPIIGLTGTALIGLLLVLSLPGLITGFGLLGHKPWARVLGIVLAILQLVNVPIGTILGILCAVGASEQRHGTAVCRRPAASDVLKLSRPLHEPAICRMPRP